MSSQNSRRYTLFQAKTSASSSGESSIRTPLRCRSWFSRIRRLINLRSPSIRSTAPMAKSEPEMRSDAISVAYAPSSTTSSESAKVR